MHVTEEPDHFLLIFSVFFVLFLSLEAVGVHAFPTEVWQEVGSSDFCQSVSRLRTSWAYSMLTKVWLKTANLFQLVSLNKAPEVAVYVHVCFPQCSSMFIDRACLCLPPSRARRLCDSGRQPGVSRGPCQCSTREVNLLKLPEEYKKRDDTSVARASAPSVQSQPSKTYRINGCLTDICGGVCFQKYKSTQMGKRIYSCLSKPDWLTILRWKIWMTKWQWKTDWRREKESRVGWRGSAKHFELVKNHLCFLAGTGMYQK